MAGLAVACGVAMETPAVPYTFVGLPSTLFGTSSQSSSIADEFDRLSDIIFSIPKPS